MKCKALFFTLLLLPFTVRAQNLVPNWSFEEYEECPDGMAQIDRANGWMSFSLSPDYYNECDDSDIVGVPYNAFCSYKEALHGVAYSGFGQLTLPSEFREILAIQLSQPLEVGEEYYASFYVSRGIPPNSDCWANKIGALFTSQVFVGWPLEETMPISNSNHINTEYSISDTIGWSKIEGTFIADSNYTYLTIGNHFNPDSVEVTCNTQGDYQAAYYFIDCVCVSADESDCPNCSVSTSTSQLDNLKSSPLVFPNPFNQEIRIVFAENDVRSKQLSLYEIQGKSVKTIICNDEKCNMSGLDRLRSGLYFLDVEFEDGEKKQFKVIKN